MCAHIHIHTQTHAAPCSKETSFLPRAVDLCGGGVLCSHSLQGLDINEEKDQEVAAVSLQRTSVDVPALGSGQRGPGLQLPMGLA